MCAANRGKDSHELQEQLSPHLPEHRTDIISFSLCKRLKDENDNVKFIPSNNVLHKSFRNDEVKEKKEGGGGSGIFFEIQLSVPGQQATHDHITTAYYIKTPALTNSTT